MTSKQDYEPLKEQHLAVDIETAVPSAPMNENEDEAVLLPKQQLLAWLLISTFIDIFAAGICFLSPPVITVMEAGGGLDSTTDFKRLILWNASMIVLGAIFSLSAIKMWDSYSRLEYGDAFGYSMPTFLVIFLFPVVYYYPK